MKPPASRLPQGGSRVRVLKFVCKGGLPPHPAADQIRKFEISVLSPSSNFFFKLSLIDLFPSPVNVYIYFMKDLSEISRSTPSGMMNTSMQLPQTQTTTSLEDGLQSSACSTFATPANLIPHNHSHSQSRSHSSTSHSQHQKENLNNGAPLRLGSTNHSILHGMMEQTPVATSESSGALSSSSAIDPAMITASGKKAAVGRWTEEEHRLFLEGLRTFPYRAWKKIATLIETRTVVQIRTHAQKYYQKLQKEGLPKETPHLEEHQQRQKMRQQKADAATNEPSKQSSTGTGNMMTMGSIPSSSTGHYASKIKKMKVRKLSEENVNNDGRYTTSDEEYEDDGYSSSTTDHLRAVRRPKTTPAKRKRKSSNSSRRKSLLGHSDHLTKTDQMKATHKRVQILRRASISSICSTTSSAIAGDDELDDEFNSTNEEDDESLDFSGFSSSQEENSTSMIRMKMKHKLLFLSSSSHHMSGSEHESSMALSPHQHQPEDESSSMDDDPFLQSSQATSMETEIENLPLHIQLTIDDHHGNDNQDDEEVQDLKEEIENVNFLHLSPMSKEMGDFNTDEESLQWFGATTGLSKLSCKKKTAVKKVLVFQDAEDQLHRSLTEDDDELLTEEEDYSCCSSSYYAQSLDEILDYGFKSGSYSTVACTSVAKTEETIAAKIDDMDPEDFVNKFFTTKVIC